MRNDDGPFARRNRRNLAPSKLSFRLRQADIGQMLSIQFAQLLQLPVPRARRSNEIKTEFPNHVEHPCFFSNHGNSLRLDIS